MGSTKIKQPNVPLAPTAEETAQAYASALPIYYQTAMQYEPQMAALEKQINEQLYPNTAGLQENLASQAANGMNATPDWYKNQLMDTLKSQFGSNIAYNPQSQEQFGVATQQGLQDYQNYYRNLALQVSGRQALAQSPNIMQTYTPAANMQNSATNYGNYSGLYGNMYNVNAQQSQYNPWMNLAGSLAGGISGAATSYGLGKIK